jgi:hypothetical protein
MGAVMFDAFFFHCQPIFLFHLLPSVKSFGVCEFTLKNLGYHYIETIEQITPNYFSNVEISTLIFDDAKIWPINSQKILSTNS